MRGSRRLRRHYYEAERVNFGGSMPLIPQQAVIVVSGTITSQIMAEFDRRLNDYPPVRIISMSVSGTTYQTLYAVIETV